MNFKIKTSAAHRRIWASVISICVLMIWSTPCQGRDFNESSDSTSRPVLAIYNLEGGSMRTLSTYLSPLYYHGWTTSLSGSWTKDFNRWPDRCEMKFESSIDFGRTINPAKTAEMYALTASFDWGLSWKKELFTGLTLTLGPMLDIYGGALYLSRNGNNPVSALAYVGLDISASLRWRTKWGRLPVEIAEEARIPSIGTFFCPEYGESYYEIYLGNHRGLAHVGWWGNAPGINNLLALRLDLGRTGLQIGYRLDLRLLQANHLENQLLRNAIVIGVIPNL